MHDSAVLSFPFLLKVSLAWDPLNSVPFHPRILDPRNHHGKGACIHVGIVLNGAPRTSTNLIYNLNLYAFEKQECVVSNKGDFLTKVSSLSFIN